MAIMFMRSYDGTEVEFVTSSELGKNDRFIAAGQDPYNDIEHDAETLDNVWIKLITPIDQIKNEHNKLWAKNNFNEENLIGPFATLGEAIDCACDPLLGVVMGEALIRPERAAEIRRKV